MSAACLCMSGPGTHISAGYGSAVCSPHTGRLASIAELARPSFCDIVIETMWGVIEEDTRDLHMPACMTSIHSS